MRQDCPRLHLQIRLMIVYIWDKHPNAATSFFWPKISVGHTLSFNSTHPERSMLVIGKEKDTSFLFKSFTSNTWKKHHAFMNQWHRIECKLPSRANSTRIDSIFFSSMVCHLASRSPRAMTDARSSRVGPPFRMWISFIHMMDTEPSQPTHINDFFPHFHFSSHWSRLCILRGIVSHDGRFPPDVQNYLSITNCLSKWDKDYFM